jgi:hypothetical protein
LPRCYRLVAARQPAPRTIDSDSTHHSQEEVMGKAIPTHHPAVVLRSHFNWLRALLVIALLAVAGLAAAVVIVATDDDADTSAVPAQQAGARYDGGPEEGSAASLIQRSAPATFDPNSIKSAPGVRYDGGPEEGSRGAGH